MIFIFHAKENETIQKSIEIHDNMGSNISSQIDTIASDKGTKVEMINSTMIDNICKLDLNLTPSENKSSESILKDQIVIKMKDGRSLNIPLRIVY